MPYAGACRTQCVHLRRTRTCKHSTPTSHARPRANKGYVASAVSQPSEVEVPSTAAVGHWTQFQTTCLRVRDLSLSINMGSSQVQNVSRVDELSVRQDAIHLEGSKLVAAGLYFCHRHVAASGEANKDMPRIVGPSFRATQTRGPGQSRPPEELRMRRLRSVCVSCVSSGVLRMWCGGAFEGCKMDV